MLGLAVLSVPVIAQETALSEREALYYRYLEFPSLVKGGSIEPQWMADGSSFWYAEGAPANTVVYRVDPNANTKTPLFDTARLRRALAPLVERAPSERGLPFDRFTFGDDKEKAVRFALEGNEFILDLDTYKISRPPGVDRRSLAESLAEPFGWAKEEPSPDGRWYLGVQDHNLRLRSAEHDSEAPLTTDGTEGFEWGVRGAQWNLDRRISWAWWAPDSSRFAVKRIDSREVSKTPIVDWLSTVPEIEWVHGEKPGQRGPRTEIFLFDARGEGRVRVEVGEEPVRHFHIIGWRPDGSELLFLRMDREGKRLDLMAANSTTGDTRVILTEISNTFVIAWGFEPFVEQRRVTLLESGDRFIWLSERDGWNHLHLYDMQGRRLRRLTEGLFPVVQVVAVDERDGWVYFTAHGDKKRPYDTHLYRVSLGGRKFKRLTGAKGVHRIRFSPSGNFFLDTHSSVGRPPTTELRKSDGTLLRTLARADIELLEELRWRPPEEFVVKAADGRSDLHGVLYKPFDFDPNKHYPVIEVIYGGPQFIEVPHTFTHPHGLDFHAEHGQALAQLGFIVFVVDGRGTPERGKAFQDVVYGSFGHHEIPDHVAALKRLAESRPYMDLSRVGICGWSFGGYFTVRALLLAPDVYHVGVAGGDGGEPYDLDHDVYMGLPDNNREGYEYASNRRLASKLEGPLLLIVGTQDANAFAPTMRLISALIEAGKPYDLLILPGQGHRITGTARTYMLEAVRRYFDEHLKP